MQNQLVFTDELVNANLFLLVQLSGQRARPLAIRGECQSLPPS
jgi:hypothetical protein